MRIDPAHISRVLVIGLSCIGDMLLSMPGINNLKHYLPKARFTLWAGPTVVNVFKHDPMWSDLVPYDRWSPTSEFYGFKGRLRALRIMRKGHFDLVVDLRETLMPLFIGARYAPLLLLKRPFLPKTIHEAERVIQKIYALGVPIVSRSMSYYVPEEERQYAEETLLSFPQKKLVIANPGGREHKRWPVENVIELSQRLIEKRQCLIGIMGYTEEEQTIASRIVKSLPSDYTLNLFGRVPMPRIAAILQKADLFVTNDSGPLHLASAMGTPTVAIYGPSLPDRFGPWGNRHIVLLSQLPCAPCDEGEKCLLGNRLKCLGHISVEDALQACDNLLK